MALFGGLIRALCAQIGLRFGFVLASFCTRLPVFSIKYWLRSYYFLFMVMPSFPLVAWTIPFCLAPRRPGASLPQSVHNKTTVIGYHSSVRLSRWECKKQ